MMFYVTKAQIKIHDQNVVSGTGLFCTTTDDHLLAQASQNDIKKVLKN